MRRATYTDEQKAEALRILAEQGKAEASRATGIPAGTIASWGSRAGVQAPAAAATAVATAARVATIAEQKAELAEGLLADARRIRRELFAARVERKAFGPGKDHDSEVVDIDYDTTSDAQRKVAVESIAKIVETVNLLTGEATQRIEQLGDGAPAPQRAAAEATVLRLAGAA